MALAVVAVCGAIAVFGILVAAKGGPGRDTASRTHMTDNAVVQPAKPHGDADKRGSGQQTVRAPGPVGRTEIPAADDGARKDFDAMFEGLGEKDHAVRIERIEAFLRKHTDAALCDKARTILDAEKTAAVAEAADPVAPRPDPAPPGPADVVPKPDPKQEKPPDDQDPDEGEMPKPGPKPDELPGKAVASPGERLFSRYKTDLLPLLKSGRFQEARDLLDAIARDPEMAEAAEQVAREKTDIQAALDVRRRAIEALRGKAGERLSLTIGAARHSGTIEDEPGRESVNLKMTGGAMIAILPEQLDAEDACALAPSRDGDQPADDLRRRGLLFLAAGNAERARGFFLKARDAGSGDKVEPHLDRAERILFGDDEWRVRKAVAKIEADEGKSLLEGMQLWLKLDEGTGTAAADSSGKSGAGTLTGGVAWSEGKTGRALSFDGKDDCVEISRAPLNRATNWSWAAWISPANSGCIYSEGNPNRTFQLYAESDGSVCVRMWHEKQQGYWLEARTEKGTLQFSAWNHLAMTMEAAGLGKGALRFYINGRLAAAAQGQKESNKDTKYAALGDNVGAHNGGKQLRSCFKGSIGSVRIYDRALSDGEVAYLAARAEAAGPRVQDPKTKEPALDPPKAEPRITYLCDLPEKDASVGHGDFGKKGALGYGGESIALGGQKSLHGLSMHPAPNGSSRVTYMIGKKYRMLKASSAINDTSRGSKTALVFKVMGDGKVLWQSSPLKKKGDWQECAANVTGVDKLELVVECPGPSDGAHAVWIEPHLLK